VASVSAIEDFPVPGGPKRKIERPLLIAGPSWRRVFSGRTRCWRGPDVSVLGERLARALLPFHGDDVDVGRGRRARAALDLDEVLGLEELENAEEDLGERQANHVGQVGCGGLTLLVEDLQDEVGDEPLGETGLLDRDGRDRGGSLRG